MKVFSRIISVVLLVVLSLSIIPLESFHHHEEHSIVCTDSSSHVENKEYECHLADFVLPLFTKENNSIEIEEVTFRKELILLYLSSELDLRINQLKTRGPPGQNLYT